MWYFFYLFIHLMGFVFVGILWWWVREFLLCFGIPFLFLSSWLIIIMMTVGKFDLLFWVSSIFCLMYVPLWFDHTGNYIVDPPKILLWVTTLLCLITLGSYIVSTLECLLRSASITLHVKIPISFKFNFQNSNSQIIFKIPISFKFNFQNSNS